MTDGKTHFADDDTLRYIAELEALRDQLGLDGLGGASVRIDAFGCKQFTEEAMNGLQSRLAELSAILEERDDMIQSQAAEIKKLLNVVEFVSTDPCFKVLGTVTQDEVTNTLKELDAT